MIKKQITFLKNFPVRDTKGILKPTYVEFITCYAEIQINNGREWYSANKVNSEIQGVFVIVYREWCKYIEATMQVTYDGKTYKIIGSPIDKDGSKRELIIAVQEVK